jgi:hypothetical protein
VGHLGAGVVVPRVAVHAGAVAGLLARTLAPRQVGGRVYGPGRLVIAGLSIRLSADEPGSSAGLFRIWHSGPTSRLEGPGCHLWVESSRGAGLACRA